MREHTIPLYCTCSVSQRCKKTRATSLRRPFCSLNIRPKFKMTGVSERGRRKLYFDPTVVTVSQKLADLYSLTSLFSCFFCHSNPSQPHIYNASCTQCLFIVLAQCHSAANRRGLLPFGGRLVAEIFVQNLKWTCVSERGRRKLYFDPTFFTVSQKTCWVIQLDIIICRLLLPFKSLPATACVHNAFVLYLLSVTALQKDEGYFPSAAVL